MSERIQPNVLSPEVSAENYCQQLKLVVELALKHFGNLRPDRLTRFAGRLSTHASKVRKGVNMLTLSYKCGTFSSELQESLAFVGLETTIHCSSKNAGMIEHLYLVPDNAPCDVIIDPTIGQFVVGHNHVFVGTREELRNLILSPTGVNGSYRLSVDRTDPEQLFERIWGKSSKPVSPFIGSPHVIFIEERYQL